MNKKIRDLLAAPHAKKLAVVAVGALLGVIGMQADPVIIDAIAQVLIGVITL
jgi:hypothetical protein